MSLKSTLGNHVAFAKVLTNIKTIVGVSDDAYATAKNRHPQVPPNSLGLER